MLSVGKGGTEGCRRRYGGQRLLDKASGADLFPPQGFPGQARGKVVSMTCLEVGVGHAGHTAVRHTSATSTRAHPLLAGEGGRDKFLSDEAGGSGQGRAAGRDGRFREDIPQQLAAGCGRRARS